MSSKLYLSLVYASTLYSNHWSGALLNLDVKSKKSKIGTFRVLWVSCSIFPFTQFSATRPIPPLTIQKIFPMKSATLSVALISGIILGILGAGGRTGNAISTFGMNDGSSGNCGGEGSTGILSEGMLIGAIVIFISGGSGRLGSCGKGRLIGTRLNLGKSMSIPNST